MNPKVDRNPPLAATLCCLALSTTACLVTRWAADALGADWRLATALAIGAGLGTLVVLCACCVGTGDGQ